MTELNRINYTMTIDFKDTSYFSIVRGLEEILERIKNDEDTIQLGNTVEYNESYNIDTDNGNYKVKITSS